MNLIDNEIIKAFEDAVICVGQAPFVEKVAKGEQLKSEIIDFINRQKAEIERLKTLESFEKYIYNKARGVGTEFECEFATKEARDISYANAIDSLVDIATARIAGIRELAERLSALCEMQGCIDISDIKGTYKEMTE